jgi:hypothetical protein
MEMRDDLADVALAQGRPGDAVALAQRAVSVVEEDGPALQLAQARFALARALGDASTDAGHERARAVALAQQARDGFRVAGRGRAEELSKVEQWLDERRHAP